MTLPNPISGSTVSEEIEYKAKHLKREINPIIGILEDPESEEKSVAQIADEIIGALDEVRDKQNAVCVVARVSYDHGLTWQFFVMGPYKSRAVAKQKGEALTSSGASWTCKWLMFDMVKDYRAFLKALVPTEDEGSAWAGSVPASLIRETKWIEPPEEGGPPLEES